MNRIIQGERKKQRLPRGEKKKLGNGKRGNLASVTRQENLLLLFLFLPFSLLPRPWNERERERDRERESGRRNEFLLRKILPFTRWNPAIRSPPSFFFACYIVTSPISQLSSVPDPPNCIWTVASLFGLFQGSFFFLSRAASKQANKQTGSRSKKAHAHAQQKKNLAGPGHKARRPSSDWFGRWWATSLTLKVAPAWSTTAQPPRLPIACFFLFCPPPPAMKFHASELVSLLPSSH